MDESETAMDTRDTGNGAADDDDDLDDTEKVSDSTASTSTTAPASTTKMSAQYRADVNIYVGSSEDDDIEVVENTLKRRRAVKLAAQKRVSTTKLSDNEYTLKGLRNLESTLGELSRAYKPFPMN